MRRTIIQIICLLSIIRCYGQTSVILVDSIDLQPVPFVFAADIQRKFSKESDEHGEVAIDIPFSPQDTIVFSRIGYNTKRIPISEISDTIKISAKPIILQDVSVTPKKKKTLGSLYMPSKWLQKFIKDSTKTKEETEHFHKEIGRKFKLKHNSRINKVRIYIRTQGTPTLILSVYRRQKDKKWSDAISEPIVLELTEELKEDEVVEFDTSETLNCLPKGTYLFGLHHVGGGCSYRARVQLFDCSLSRDPVNDEWIERDLTMGMEIDIEY